MMLLASTSSPRGDQRRRRPSSAIALDGHRRLFGAHRGALALLEVGGEEQVRVLVGESRRVVELAQLAEPAGARGRSPPRAHAAAVASGGSPSTSRLPAGHLEQLAARRRRGTAARGARCRRRRPAPPRPRRGAARRGGRTPRRRAPATRWRCDGRNPASQSVLETEHAERRSTLGGLPRRGRVSGLDSMIGRRGTPAFGPLAGGPHERREQRVRAVGTALELGVRLRADEERVVGQLDELHQPVVGRQARAHQPGLFELGAVLVVHLVAVAVPLVDDLFAVGLLHDRAGQRASRGRRRAAWCRPCRPRRAARP